jgi:hypothetical protein
VRFEMNGCLRSVHWCCCVYLCVVVLLLCTHTDHNNKRTTELNFLVRSDVQSRSKNTLFSFFVLLTFFCFFGQCLHTGNNGGKIAISFRAVLHGFAQISIFLLSGSSPMHPKAVGII